MTYFPTIASSPALWTTLQQALDPPGAGPIWYDGPDSFARRLTLQGYSLVRGPRPVRQVLWIRRLPGRPDEALASLCQARDCLAPGGLILVVELAAAPGPGTGWAARLGVRLGWSHPAQRLARWFLEARLSPVCQRWPQGMRAWLVTCARPGSPNSHVFPVENSRGSDRMPPGPGGA